VNGQTLDQEPLELRPLTARATELQPLDREVTLNDQVGDASRQATIRKLGWAWRHATGSARKAPTAFGR